jgi:undecaprenyl phosphate N,N'-diacetylbacillosamine 1-phosphate transferase
MLRECMIYFVTKRIFDVLIAFIFSIVLAPLMVLLLLIDWIILREAPIFRQKRLGLRRRSFVLLKVKTMRSNTVYPDNIDGFANFLRTSGLDEIPQLLNVISGQMSLVGPRPLPVDYEKWIKKEHMERFEVLPGITGLSQVSGGNLLSWKEKFDLDNHYVNRKSLLFDLKILVKTVLMMLSKRKSDRFLPLTENY